MPLHLQDKYSFHFQIVHVNLEREKTSLYLTHALKTFSLSLIGIFVPIYIFTLTQNLTNFHINSVVNGLIWVFVYYCLRSSAVVLGILTFSKLMFSTIKLNRSLVISFFFFILSLLCLINARQNLLFIIPAAIFSGFDIFLYWVTYHIFFVHKFKNKNHSFGTNTSLRQFFTRITSASAPIIGGIIISFSSFNVLFSLAIALLLICSSIVMFNIKEWDHKKHSGQKIVEKYLFNKDFKLLSLSFAGMGGEVLVYETLWPIVMFIILANFLQLGTLNSISFAVASIVTLAIGHLGDKKGFKIIHLIGSSINGLLYIPRIFLQSPGLVYTVDLLDKANSPLYALPNMTQAYSKAQNLGESDFILYREIVIHLAIALFALVFIILLDLGIIENWRILFIAGLFSSFIVYLINLDKH